MSLEMEHMWEAMKDVHYRRTLELLKEEIGQADCMETALTAALNRMVHVVHAQAGTFWYYDRFGDDRIRPRAVCGGSDIGDYSLAPGEGVAGQVILTGTSALIPNCQKDPRWAGKVDSKTGFCTRTMICVPLKVDQVTFGSIQIINKTDKLPFDERDLSFAQNLADAAAELLAEGGLLGGYGALGGQPGNDPVTFESIVCAGSLRQMERTLRSSICFQRLSRSQQAEVRDEMEKIHQIFLQASPKNEAEKKGGLLGLFR